MLSAQEILNALLERKVKQGAIAKVLGIQQPNVSTLFNPVKRTGKPRELTYEEGRLLIKSFGLNGAAHAPPRPWVPKPETIADLLAVAMHVDADDAEKRGELLDYASAVHTGLEWISKDPASEDDPGFLKGVRLRVAESIDDARSASSKAS